MNSAELKKAKRDVRRRVLEARDAIDPAARRHIGEAIAGSFLALPEVTRAGTVMVFWSFGSEVPTAPILEGLVAAGTRVALPRIECGDLEPHTWSPGDPMTPTAFGALEPEDGEVLRPGDIDVIATPAIAFDRSGRRIGYGGGFYDRFFLQTRPDAARIGIGFSLQLWQEPLPGAAFDLRVQAIVTEDGVVRCEVGD